MNGGSLLVRRVAIDRRTTKALTQWCTELARAWTEGNEPNPESISAVLAEGPPLELALDDPRGFVVEGSVLGPIPPDMAEAAKLGGMRALVLTERLTLASARELLRLWREPDPGAGIAEVDVPGVRSKRWTPEATDRANNEKLIASLRGIENRRARYRCAMALVTPLGERSAEGTCWGTIAFAPRGAGGFGYDPFFLPDAYPGRTMAEVTAEEKHRVSHRGQAFRALPALLHDLD